MTASEDAQPADELRQRIAEQASAQVDRLAAGARQLGEELGQLAAGTGQPGLGAQLVRLASDSSHGVAGYLERREPADLAADVRDLAGRRSTVVILGAALAGVVAGRLLQGGPAGEGPAAGKAGTAGTRAAGVRRSRAGGGSPGAGSAGRRPTFASSSDGPDGSAENSPAGGSFSSGAAGGATFTTTDEVEAPAEAEDRHGAGRFLSPGQDPGSSGEAPRGYAT